MAFDQFMPSSFRDPSGQVFMRHGRIFRTITHQADQVFKQVEATGWLDELVETDRLVAWKDAEVDFDAWGDDNIVRVLEHEPLTFISYPYEWSFGALKAAALAHLDIHLEALSRGLTLSDATAYNMQFKGPRPIFIDHLSFRPYAEGEFWTGHRQFCEQFLNPLLLTALVGVPYHAWYRGNLEGIPTAALARLLRWRDLRHGLALINVMLPSWFERRMVKKQSAAAAQRAMSKRTLPKSALRGMLERLRTGIDRLQMPYTATVWADYTARSTYTAAEAERKRRFITSFCHTVQPRLLWDIGCNTGVYAQLALASGARDVIGFEQDTNALETAYHRAVGEQSRFTPLWMDVANPSPAQGWNQVERDGLLQRRSADGVMALALVHHLCIGRNIPLPEVVQWLVGCAAHGVIEFVPKGDPCVGELLRFRPDVFTEYSDQAFEAILRRIARVIKSETVTASGRRLIWFERL